MLRSLLLVAAAVVALVSAADPPEVEIKYFNTTNCDNDATSTQVTTQSRLCNLVPGAPNPSSYKVTCNSKGDGGQAFFCSDTTCTNCPGTFTFSDNQCTNIDPRYGSTAAKFDCKGGDSGAASTTASVAAAAAGAVAAVAIAFRR